MEKLTAKFGNMRKEVEWVIYPQNNGDTQDKIKIQSDHRVMIIDTKTGEGILSRHCSNGAYFPHLTKDQGATLVGIPKEIVDEIIKLQCKSGDVLIQKGDFKVIAA